MERLHRHLVTYFSVLILTHPLFPVREADRPVLSTSIVHTHQRPDSVVSEDDKPSSARAKISEEKPDFPMGTVSFADSVVLYDPGAPGEGNGGEPDPEFQNAASILGNPDDEPNNESRHVSLGRGGTIVILFTDNVLIDGPGPDLYIFQVDADAQDSFVWISQDDRIYLSVGMTSTLHPTIDIQPFAAPGATYRYVKLRDDPAQGEQDGPTVGADIDAVGAINTAIQLHVPADDIFETGTSKFTPGASKVLSKIAAKIRNVAHASVLIQTHTDDRGIEDFNLLVSQSQAGSIRNHFWDVEYLTDADYAILGWGESKPIAPNDTEEGRRKNRRVEILIRTSRNDKPSDETMPVD